MISYYGSIKVESSFTHCQSSVHINTNLGVHPGHFRSPLLSSFGSMCRNVLTYHQFKCCVLGIMELSQEDIAWNVRQMNQIEMYAESSISGANNRDQIQLRTITTSVSAVQFPLALEGIMKRHYGRGYCGKLALVL